MIKKVERDDFGKPKIYHISTLRRHCDWECFFNDNADIIMEKAITKGCMANGEYIVIPVVKQLLIKGNNKIIKGSFQKPVYRTWL